MFIPYQIIKGTTLLVLPVTQAMTTAVQQLCLHVILQEWESEVPVPAGATWVTKSTGSRAGVVHSKDHWLSQQQSTQMP